MKFKKRRIIDYKYDERIQKGFIDFNFYDENVYFRSLMHFGLRFLKEKESLNVMNIDYFNKIKPILINFLEKHQLKKHSGYLHFNIIECTFKDFSCTIDEDKLSKELLEIIEYEI